MVKSTGWCIRMPCCEMSWERGKLCSLSLPQFSCQYNRDKSTPVSLAQQYLRHPLSWLLSWYESVIPCPSSCLEPLLPSSFGVDFPFSFMPWATHSSSSKLLSFSTEVTAIIANILPISLPPESLQIGSSHGSQYLCAWHGSLFYKVQALWNTVLKAIHDLTSSLPDVRLLAFTPRWPYVPPMSQYLRFPRHMLRESVQ